MLSNSQIKRLRSLHIKKYRLEENQFLIEGPRLIEEAFYAKAKILGIWCTDKFRENHSSFLSAIKRTGHNWEITSAKSLSQICDSRSNQGICALLPLPNQNSFTCNNDPVLLLDNISDPGNLGTILRTTEWFGVKHVVLSIESVDAYNSKVLRSAMGAHFHLHQFIQQDLISTISKLKKESYRIIGAEMDGTSLDKFYTPEKWALVLGNEAHGISSEIQSQLDERITIPKTGNIESLNVGVASGVILEAFMKK